MDEKALLAASENDYMNRYSLTFFDRRLQQLRAETLQEITAFISLMLVHSPLNVLDSIQQEKELQMALGDPTNA